MRWRDTHYKENLIYTKVVSKSNTYVYFKIPSSFEVQIMMLLSADPEANLLPAEDCSSS